MNDEVKDTLRRAVENAARRIAFDDHRKKIAGALREYLVLRRNGRPTDVDGLLVADVPPDGWGTAHDLIAAVATAVETAVAAGETADEVCIYASDVLRGCNQMYPEIVRDAAELGRLLNGGQTDEATDDD